jgi:anaerobic magnesium-protoporphyrin IX monomethyl ester cyclase
MADVTLINLNLMYSVANNAIDFQVYNPLGLLYIASCLGREGFEVDFRDYQLSVRESLQDPFNLERFAEFARNHSRIVGIGCMSNLLPFAVLVARRLKADRPDTVVILGGVGPTGVPFETMASFGWIDHVCVGEGEAAMIEFMHSQVAAHRTSRQFKPVLGIVSRSATGLVYEQRPRITDLDSFPLPAYDLIDFRDYDAAFSVITSRGCPFHCTFCTETNHWNNQVVFRGVPSVLEEVKLLSGRSSKRVVLFQDDQLTLNRSRAVELFRRLASDGLGMKWKAFVRVDEVDDELLELMAASGCIQVRFGIESGSDRILREIRKGFTIAQAFEAVRMALKYIPSVHASFIWGYPFETVEECQETLRQIERFTEVGCTALPFMLSPLPNSDIYRGYRGPLDFNENIMANFNVSGAENVLQKRTKILKTGAYLFDFIRQHPRVFPGFFVYDYKNNVAPKAKLVRKSKRYVFRELKKLSIPGYKQVDL